FAARSNVPKIMLARMAFNIAINTIIGAIPVFGDLFSIWFKSNVKNVHLLEEYLRSGQEKSRTVDWLFLIGLLLGVLFILVAVIISITWLLKRVWEVV
ncbi:MAG: DUF4112 domain-containing protein, partial [Deltaproteobacteria bacterium]|nr:DUF4112 domain-containing protein [Deltaproteobacteria bacterium]